MIDLNFLRKVEGFKLCGYVPVDDSGVVQSGVTVATGIDLGQQSKGSLFALQLNKELLVKLLPFVGIKGSAASELLKILCLHLTEEEALSLDTAVIERDLKNLVTLFNRDTAEVKFQALPKEFQTVIYSVKHQYGNLVFRTPQFWRQVTNNDWYEAYANLLNFKDSFPTRRHKEAALWLEGIKTIEKELNNG